MTTAEIVLLAVKASIAGLTFSLGLRSRPEDIFSFIKRPGMLARSFLALNLVMPLFALASDRSVRASPRPRGHADRAVAVAGAAAAAEETGDGARRPLVRRRAARRVRGALDRVDPLAIEGLGLIAGPAVRRVRQARSRGSWRR
jgi:hypothetical protein